MIKPKVLFLYSNNDLTTKSTHYERIKIAQEMGIDIESFCIADYVDVNRFSKLNLMYKLKNKKLYKLYEVLEKKFKKIDVLIHFNGAGIHPDFLNKFNFLKIYHCADDPDASRDLSFPVANQYDIQAISNPTCIKDYYELGCKNVFFWPLGAQFYRENNLKFASNSIHFEKRNRDLLFIGDIFGIPKYMGVNKLKSLFEKLNFKNELDFLYEKKGFFNELKSQSVFVNGYGKGWDNGFCTDKKAYQLYSNSMFGINIHNKTGPINFRLYDLAAFGVCQFCDCKSTLDFVFKDGVEILGYSSVEELVDLYNFHLKNVSIAEKIANNARKRYLKEYTTMHLWKKLNKYIMNFTGINLFS